MRGLVASGLLVALLGAAATPPAAPPDAPTILGRMIARNPNLQSYRSRVHVNVRMLNFPFLAPQLDGTSYYRRPDTYEVVFDRVPGYAKGFSRLFDDIGDPAVWAKDNTVTVQGTRALAGRPVFVLQLVKKKHSDVLARSLAYVDASTYALVQMEWDYTSGGKIVMQQAYAVQNGYSVLSAQHATIDIPHVRAVADASYTQYQTNVALETAGKP